MPPSPSSPANHNVPASLRQDIMGVFVRAYRAGDTLYRGFHGDPSMPSYRGERERFTVLSVRKRQDGSFEAILSDSKGRTVRTTSDSSHPNEVYEFTDETWDRVLKRTEQAAKVTSLSDLASELASLRQSFDDFSETLTESVVRLAEDVSSGRRDFAATLSSKRRGGEPPPPFPSRSPSPLSPYRSLPSSLVSSPSSSLLSSPFSSPFSSPRSSSSYRGVAFWSVESNTSSKFSDA